MRFLYVTAALVAAPVAAQDMGAMPGMAPPGAPPAAAGHEDHGVHAMPGVANPPQPPAAAGHEGHDMADMAGAPHAMPAHAMQGAFGPYPMNREASGTAWQPDTTPHSALHAMRGDWMLMGHALINGVYDHQTGPRGDSKGFVSGMVMGMAQRSFANGDALQFRAMLSPDPFMGKAGYPILLATGETANGRDQLTDRQHPHDLFMELSASYSFRLGTDSSLFFYGGLPGEPAFGPPAFMHRLSILDSPEAPISHHWLDSTHITWGVLTAGVTKGQWKLEASRYHGREPDQYRYGFEAGKLDSTAIRLSWNPNRSLSLQASWARQISPEQLEPTRNQTKWSASAILTRPVGEKGWWSTTIAWGRRSSEHDQLDAFVLESAVHPDDRWTIFARAERTENDELVTLGGEHGPTYRVGKASLGAIRDLPIAKHVKLGLGALYAVNFVPRALDPLYGRARGAMGFVRLKID